MPPVESCLIKAKGIVGDLFTNEELVDMFNKAAEVKQRQIDLGFTDNLDARVDEAIKKQSQRAKRKALARKTRTQNNIMQVDDLYNDIVKRTKEGLSPFKAVISQFHGTIKGIENGRVSKERDNFSYESKFIGDAFGKIAREQPQIIGMLRNKPFDKDVTRELMELNAGGKPGVTKNSDAKFLAEVLNRQLKISRLTLAKFGAPLEDVVGYIGPEAHNDIKINGKMDDWIAHLVGGALDLDATFPDLIPSKNKQLIVDVLKQAYTQIITGKNTAFGTVLGSRVDEPPITSTFVFTNADAAIAYQDKWGYDSTISTILTTLESRAHDAALMQKFGANPSQTLNKVLTKLRKTIEDQGGDRSDTALLHPSNFESVVSIATGQINHIQHHTMAKVSSEIRAASQMALLGKAVLAAMPADVMTMAAASMFRGDGFVRGFMGAIFKSMDGMTSAERKAAAYYYGEGFDSILGHLSRYALAEDGRIGAISKHANTYFKFNGLSPWTDSRRAISARMIAAQLGRESDKAYDALHWRLRNVLNQNGIQEKDWDNIRSLVQTGTNGNKYIYPEGFDKLTHLTKYEKEQLELTLRGYVADEVNMGMLEGGAQATYYSPSRLDKRGSLIGEVARSITMFTTFPMVFGIRVLGRAFIGAPGKTAAERVMRNAPHAGVMMASMLAAGYASWMLKEISKGNTPPIPDTENMGEFTRKIMIDSGVAGYYGSLLIDAMFNNRGFEGGPVLETATTQASAIGNLLMGDLEGAARAQYDAVLSVTPYQNLFYLRPVLDALFLNSIDEIMHPKRPERAKKTREKFNQERIW